MKKIVSNLMHKYVVLFVIASLMMLTTMPTIAAITSPTVTPITVQEFQTNNDSLKDCSCTLVELTDDQMTDIKGEMGVVAVCAIITASCAALTLAYTIYDRERSAKNLKNLQNCQKVSKAITKPVSKWIPSSIKNSLIKMGGLG